MWIGNSGFILGVIDILGIVDYYLIVGFWIICRDEFCVVVWIVDGCIVNVVFGLGIVDFVIGDFLLWFVGIIILVVGVVDWVVKGVDFESDWLWEIDWLDIWLVLGLVILVGFVDKDVLS